MEVILFTLVLYLGDPPSPIEWMAFHEDASGEWQKLNLGGCLAMRRTLARQGWRDSPGTGTRYACERRRVTTRVNWEGKTVIDKLGDKV